MRCDFSRWNIRTKYILLSYLILLSVSVIAPMGYSGTALNHITVIGFRLDYLVHALLFLPLVVFWRLGFPSHSLGLILASGFLLAAGLEGLQFLLPYRGFNVNDLIWNAVGVGLGGAISFADRIRLTTAG